MLCGLCANYIDQRSLNGHGSNIHRLPEKYEDLSQLDTVYCLTGHMLTNIYKQ